jgi:hypothetical protein
MVHWWAISYHARVTREEQGMRKSVRVADKPLRMEEKPTLAGGSSGFLTTQQILHADVKHELVPKSWRRNVLPRRSYGAVAEEIFA